MNRIYVVLCVMVSLAAGVQADRRLDPDETAAFIRQLTETPRRQWLTAGTLRARHLEYYAYEQKIRQSTETLYYDGTQVRLDVCLDDEQPTDSVADADAIGRLDQDRRLNRHRIFLWDGEKRVQYYESADYAVVALDPQAAPQLSGPITAGIVPWGHGDFTYWVLMAQAPVVHDRIEDGQRRFVLQYTNETTTPDIDITLVLDPAKANAVVSYTIENDLAVMRQTYSDYLALGSEWVPAKILIERFDKRSGSERLLSYEDWQFDHIDPTVPTPAVFDVSFKNGTTVELHPGSGMQTFLYQACDRADIAGLLAEKISLLGADTATVNCATVAIGHLARRFDKPIDPQTLSPLISTTTQKTSLQAIKQTLESAGLSCLAVATDLDTLARFGDGAAVLHLALSNHYVIVDHIDSDGVWIIDLTNRSFYTRLDTATLLQEWADGTALLVSDKPVNPPLEATFRYLTADELAGIEGGDFGTYSCTQRLQVAEHILCSEPFGGFLCNGAYYAFYERYGCVEDENGGTCVGKKMIAYEYAQCVNKPEMPGACTTTQTWTPRYIRACK